MWSLGKKQHECCEENTIGKGYVWLVESAHSMMVIGELVTMAKVYGKHTLMAREGLWEAY